jgi:hypothetical protein
VPYRGTTEQIYQRFSRSFRAQTIIKPKTQGLTLLSLGLCRLGIGIPKIEMRPVPLFSLFPSIQFSGGVLIEFFPAPRHK